MIDKQTKDAPLFADLLWSRPERKEQAGKLLIIGGSTHGFASIVKAIEQARQDGIGEVKAVLPKGLAKLLPSAAECVFVEQTASGSFAQAAIADTAGYLGWADAVLIASDLTHNAETAIFIDSVARASDKPLVAFGEGLDILLGTFSRGELPRLVTVATLAQVQQLSKKSGAAEALLSSSTLEQRGHLLQKLAETTGGVVVLHDEGNYLVAATGAVARTSSPLTTDQYAVKTAVLTAQFPAKLYEATVTAPLI